MITTLNGVGKGRAQQILAKMIKSFMPTAFPVAEEGRDELYDATYKEVLATLRIGDQELDGKAITKVLALLNDEVNNLSIDNEGKNEAKKRLGQKGDLSNSAYSIDFGKQSYLFEDVGITCAEVEDAIRSSDEYLHLHRGKEAEEFVSPLSLYVKDYEYNGEESSLIVVVVRKDDVLNVSTAWRIFSSDIERVKGDNALDIFKKFVDKYGVEIRMVNSPWEKLFLYHFVNYDPARPPTVDDMSKLIQARSDRANDDVIILKVVKINELSVIEVAIAFAISLSTYCDALRRHGLDIKKYH